MNNPRKWYYITTSNSSTNARKAVVKLNKLRNAKAGSVTYKSSGRKIFVGY